jgi:hypothetical protein
VHGFVKPVYPNNNGCEDCEREQPSAANFPAMTLRDYFAAKAMALALEEYKLVCGIDGGPLADEWHWQQGLSSVAGNAYAFADAMLEARQR